MPLFIYNNMINVQEQDKEIVDKLISKQYFKSEDLPQILVSHPQIRTDLLRRLRSLHALLPGQHRYLFHRRTGGAGEMVQAAVERFKAQGHI